MNALIQEIEWIVREASAPQRRTMREFAEQEIILPSGPYEGYHFDCTRQPHARLFLDAVDSGRFNRFVSTGPIQSGKSLLCYVIPILYHLFELNETLAMGVADMNMATDKWLTDILPVIQKTKFRNWLPVGGAGSRGGKVLRVDFRNGATLRIMSGGGDDKMIAGFTARVAAATEIDGWSNIGKSRKVSDPVTELENRTSAYGDRKRFYAECTLTDKSGRTYQEITNGTNSRIVLPCPHCGAWVTPERDHVVGWQQAKSEYEAEENGAFCCPACAAPWTEEERKAANLDAKLIHRGQEIDKDGVIHGDMPQTRTLGFRWSAVNNLLLTSGEIAKKLWNAERLDDPQSVERQLCQNVFAIPYEPPITDTTPLDVKEILKRVRPLGRGIIPPGTECITVGGDIGKFTAWWIAVAWGGGASGRIIDYGAQEVKTDQWGEERAIERALAELNDRWSQGWQGPDGRIWVLSQGWIDSHYGKNAVYSFCRSAGEKFRPIMGWGGSKEPGQGGVYSHPRTIGGIVRQIGDHYNMAYQAEGQVILVHIDVDYWKTWVHRRLAVPIEAPGAITLYDGEQNEHKRLALHLTAEHQIEEFIQGQGIVTRWVRERPDNHLLDCLTYASACGHYCGVQLLDVDKSDKNMSLSQWFGGKRK